MNPPTLYATHERVERRLFRSPVQDAEASVEYRVRSFLVTDTGIHELSPRLRAKYTFGRSPRSRFTYALPNISKHHAEVRWDARKQEWELHDLESTNGTFLNDEKVCLFVPLRHSDLVTLGGRAEYHLYGSATTNTSRVVFADLDVPVGISRAELAALIVDSLSVSDSDLSDTILVEHTDADTIQGAADAAGVAPAADTTSCDTCSICLDTPYDPQITACNHIFCAPCLLQWTRHHFTCPICRRDIHPIAP